MTDTASDPAASRPTGPPHAGTAGTTHARPPLPPLPDLAVLADADKDLLIRTLWSELKALETDADALRNPAAGSSGATAAAMPHAATPAALRAALAGDGGSVRATNPPAAAVAPLGRGLRLLESRMLLVVLVLIGLAVAADLAVGWWQQGVADARRIALVQLETAASNGLYVELAEVTPQADGATFTLTVDMQEIGDTPLYVMLEPVRVFVQVGQAWQEVPSAPPAGTSYGVVRLSGGRQYQATFTPDVAGWAELIPGYMHVRVESDMLISERAEPEDDIVARKNRFYIYLKPHGADDAEIRRRSNFAGTPPVFIPMPPH